MRVRAQVKVTERLMREYGVPEAIKLDNGQPFSLGAPVG